MRNRDNARQMRKNPTDAERLVWRALRGRRFAHFKFRRQASIGKYIVDFVCFEKKLVLELDGGQHAEAEQQAWDSTRTAWLESQGFIVLQFWDHDVLKDWESIEQAIWQQLHRDEHADPLRDAE
jgi:very-short-patch-repair endonuclease